MKKLLLFAVVIAAMLAAACSNSKYKYETVKGDPLNTKIYTLDNGLKVYMSVNKETPRIQTYIAVNVGGKNDPAETTGLAHYFEHLMFKGTQQFGTSDFAAEKPMLDEIENLFEVYRKTTDEDIAYISRLCDQNNVPFASNLATAEMLVLGLDRGDLDWRDIVNPKNKPFTA